MRLSPLFLAAVLCATGATTAVHAGDTAPPDLQAIRTQQLELRAEVQAGKEPFSGLSQPTRKELALRQDRLLALLEGKESFSELSEAQQLEAFNALEWIKAAVNEAEDQRMVCEQVTKTGSHRKVRECKTVAQRRQDREEALRVMQGKYQRGSTDFGRN